MEKPWYKKWWAIILFIFVGVSILNGILSSPTTPPPQTVKQSQKDDLFAKMTASEHLNEARKALAEGKPHKDPMKTSFGRVDDARKHLAAIKEGVLEYTEAQKLMKEVERREKEIKKVSEVVAKKIMIKQRERIAEEMERNYLSEGMDVHIRLSGPEKTIMKMEYVLFSRPLVYKIVNETDFLANLKKAGFQKVIFDDRYNYSWTYDLGKI